MDVRIDPEVSTVMLDGSPITMLSLSLGGVPRGAAAIVAGPNGLNQIDAVELMNQLAQHGYESVLASPDTEVSGLMTLLVERLEQHGWEAEQTAVLGYGDGARAATLAASQTTYGAAVVLPRAAATLVNKPITMLRTPWLGLVGHGNRATLTPELVRHRDRVAAQSTEHTSLVGYPGVDHCLHDSTDPLEHTAAFDSWQRTAEWLNIHVAPRPTPRALAWQKRLATQPSLG